MSEERSIRYEAKDKDPVAESVAREIDRLNEQASKDRARADRLKEEASEDRARADRLNEAVRSNERVRRSLDAAEQARIEAAILEREQKADDAGQSDDDEEPDAEKSRKAMDSAMRNASNTPSRRDARRHSPAELQAATNAQQARMRSRTPNAYDLRGNVISPSGVTGPDATDDNPDPLPGDDEEPDAEKSRKAMDEAMRSASSRPSRKQRQRGGQ